MKLEELLDEVRAERCRQDEKFGEQNHPDGTGTRAYAVEAENARDWCDRQTSGRTLTWDSILLEEVYEALAEKTDILLRTELLQTAAVCLNWVAAIDRRNNK